MTAPDVPPGLPPALTEPPDLAPTPAPPPRGPVRERALLPDVLRGLALAGILIVNMQDFAGFREWQQHGPDRAAQVVTDIFANGRFISIFAMLFGWGAAGMLHKNAGTFLLRHAILFGIGTAHFILVWHGDIINNYALLAFFLLLTVRLSARALLGLASLLGLWWLLLAVLAGFGSLSEQTYPRFTGLPELQAAQGYASMVATRAAEYAGEVVDGNLYNGPWLLALFCLGAAAQRTGFLTHPQDFRPLLRRMRVWGLLTGLPLGVLLAYLNTKGDYASGVMAVPVRMLGGLLSAFGYIGVIGLLSVQGKLGFVRHFAASGRVAMSNYLSQSLLMTTIFYPYAGAQWGQWGAAPSLLLALSVGLLQLPISRWWLQHYGMGPMESLVRALVYGLPRRER